MKDLVEIQISGFTVTRTKNYHNPYLHVDACQLAAKA